MTSIGLIPGAEAATTSVLNTCPGGAPKTPAISTASRLSAG